VLATISDGSCTYGPTNDLCAGASTLVVNALQTATTNDNTCIEGTNPNCGGTSQIRDVWFKFVYSGGPVTITTNFTGGTLNDTRIAVYSSCGGSIIACNDDIGGGNYKSNIIIACGTLTLGQTYYIQAGGYNSTTGTFSIRVTAPVETCNLLDDDCDGQIDEGFDADGDGFTACNGDCNDNDINISPNGTETCNTIDDDCDGSVDEGVQTTYYRDQDNDGYGNISVTTLACSTPVGYVLNSLDCNDNNASIKPGTMEVCNTVDDNCNGQTDEGVQSTFYQDSDGDGFGNLNVTTLACSAPIGYSANSTDCNDLLNTAYPGATETCNSIDDDCDTQIDEGVQLTFYRDQDNDGYGNSAITTQACTAPPGYVANSTDCNDNNNTVYPGATETCNSTDDDCDTAIDEGVQTTFYRDFDNDGFGDLNTTTLACNVPVGYVTNSLDCNDNNANVNPGEIEICNTIDDDCDSNIDEGVTSTFYRDFDNDSYGNIAITVQACSAPVGYVSNSNDCNDNNSSVYPGATESCNTIDDDCDALIDEGLLLTFYRDFDNDGFGDLNTTTDACTAPVGYVANSTDCNDNNFAVKPSATEVCNNIDDDCDANIDEGFDIDNDGYTTCQGDCNDGNANIFPGAPEACNGIDDNCDTAIDNGVTFQNYYSDSDNDGYGSTLLGNFCSPPANSSLNNLDCNDSNAAINPNETELCNNIDDNCNTQVDEGFDNDNDTYTTCEGDCDDNNASVYPGASETCNSTDDDCDTQIDEGVLTTFYRDIDNDGYGQTAITTQACSAPVGFVANSADCNDSDSNIYPGASETCNNIDDDCDAAIDEGFDIDNDGYTTCEGDCNDNNAATNPGATEVCNNQDDDCDSLTDEGFDNDNDGFTTCGGDCDDNNAAIHPSQIDLCDGLDIDCDLAIDEDAVFITYYNDNDGDGYGSNTLGSFCSPPSNSSTNNNDCNDNSAAIYPGATETCNNVDDDCDTTVDDGFDNDNDGYTTCEGDCNDANATVYPGATETCNNADDDCDLSIDEGLTLLPWYIDADSDNYGSSIVSPIFACSQPSGYVANNTDCNDGLTNVYPNAIELCGNGVDEDCDGLTDENCTVGSAPNDNMNTAILIPNTGNSYPFCNALVNSCLGSTISVESNPLNVVTGEDVWFRFNAVSPGISVKLTTGEFDGVIELHDNLGAEIEVENVTGFAEPEVLNFTGLTEGNQYFIAVRNYNSSMGNGSFTLCVQALRDTWCSYGSGTFPICNNYKAFWSYAHAYTFNFTNNSTNATTSVTSNGIIALSNTTSGLMPGQSYECYVDAVYNLYDGAGNPQQIIVEGNQICHLTIASQENIQVKENQRCPVTLSPNSYLQGKPQICGAIYYKYQFTPTTSTGTPTGASFEVQTASNQPFLILAFNSPQSLTPGGYYSVRIKPVFGNGEGTYGTAQCIRMMGGAPVIIHNEEEETIIEEAMSMNEDMMISLYPNPGNGELLNLNIIHESATEAEISIIDNMGRIIERVNYTFDKELSTVHRFTKPLHAGLYLVEFRIGEEKITRKLIIQ